VGAPLLERMAGRTRRRQAIVSIQRHTLYNLVGGLVPLALALITIPLYVALIGEARYGVIAIVWLVLGYFGLFDLGLGQATAQRIAQPEAQDPAHRARIFWTALTVNLVLGLVGGALAWLLAGLFFSHMLAADSALQIELGSALPWLALAVPILTLSGVMSGALQGRERFLDLNAIAIVGAMLSQLLPLAAAALWAPRIDVLVPVIVCGRAVTLLMLMHRCRRHVFGEYRLAFDRSLTRGLLGYGGWVTVTAVVGPMMVILDRFVIGAMFGARAVSHYTIPFQLAERSAMLSAALNNALFPRLSASNNPLEVNALSSASLRVLAVIMTPLIGSCILWVKPFLTWWISAETAGNSSLVGQLLFLGFWINSLALVPYTQLQARGRPDWVAKCHLAELLPYVVLLYAGLRVGGVPGAALAFVLRALADFVLLAALAGSLGAACRLLLWPALLLVAAFGLTAQTWVAQPDISGWAPLVMLVILSWSWIQAPVPLKRMLSINRGARR
jgi:O-antigen/teichoic acid export membrane protein